MTDAISSRDVVAGGHRLRLYESGRVGAPVILWLHGSGPGVNAMANWRDIMTDLSGGYRNIAPDVLGFGDSDCPDPFPRGMGPSVDFRARNIIDLLDELGIQSAHVVGNSMGGIIALRMALLAPDRLDKIIFMGSAAEGGLEPEAITKSIEFGSNPTKETLRELLNMFVYDQGRFPVDLDALAEQRLDIATRPDIVRVGQATADPSGGGLDFSAQDLQAIGHESLVVHGREDRVLSVQRSYYLAEHLPNAQLHVFPHVGHWAHLEKAGGFKTLVEQFLEGSL